MFVHAAVGEYSTRLPTMLGMLLAVRPGNCPDLDDNVLLSYSSVDGRKQAFLSAAARARHDRRL